MTNRTYTKDEVNGIINLSAASGEFDHIMQALHYFKTDVHLAEYVFGDDADKKIRSIRGQAEKIEKALEAMREDLAKLRLEVEA